MLQFRARSLIFEQDMHYADFAEDEVHSAEGT